MYGHAPLFAYQLTFSVFPSMGRITLFTYPDSMLRNAKTMYATITIERKYGIIKIV